MRNLKLYMLATAIAACSLAPHSASAAGTVMVLGIGTMNCDKALRFDWTITGITPWIQGYMTAQEGAVNNAGENDVEFLPGESATRVAGLVMKQCRAYPEQSINDAAATIAARLIHRYNDAGF